MAKTDFKVIDISMKITNQLPMIRITEDLVVTDYQVAHVDETALIN